MRRDILDDVTHDAVDAQIKKYDDNLKKMISLLYDDYLKAHDRLGKEEFLWFIAEKHAEAWYGIIPLLFELDIDKVIEFIRHSFNTTEEN